MLQSTIITISKAKDMPNGVAVIHMVTARNLTDAHVHYILPLF